MNEITIIQALQKIASEIDDLGLIVAIIGLALVVTLIANSKKK